MSLSQKRLVLFLSVLISIFVIAFLVIKLAQGYKLDFSARKLRPSGLLVATSIPDGAQVIIDGKLRSATNNTLSLSPGEYEVEIKKEGFAPWKKKLSIKKELVTKTDTYLFSTYPDLKVLTFTGASNPVLSPDGLKVAYSVTSSTANNRGIWVLDLADRPLGLNREPWQVLQSAPKGRDFSLAKYEWSLDSKQLLVNLDKENFLVDASRLNSSIFLIDITYNLSGIRKRWENEKQLRQGVKLARFPEKLQEILQNSVKDIQFSEEETKIFYTATASASIPEKLVPVLPGSNTQPENRKIEAGKVYVYDLKEDKNFYLMDAPPAISSKSKLQSIPAKIMSWFPTSKHIFIVQNGKISIIEYDGTNKADIYSGPFEDSYAFPYPATNRFLILASLGKDTPPNLYAVTLR